MFKCCWPFNPSVGQSNRPQDKAQIPFSRRELDPKTQRRIMSCLYILQAVAGVQSPPSPCPFITVATFTILDNPSRSLVIRGAPPTLRHQGLRSPPPLLSRASSSSRSVQASTSRGRGGSFVLYAPPSSDPTYPLLALLQVLWNDKSSVGLEGVDVLSDSKTLAQILQFQTSSRAGSSNSKSSTTDKGAQRLSCFALLHNNLLVLLSNLDETNEIEALLKEHISPHAHCPIPQAEEHRRAIRYSAHDMQLLVHFPAHVSTTTYAQPFLPISHRLQQFPSSRIDFHTIPDGLVVPLEHENLVHCVLEKDDYGMDPVYEMTFSRIETLLAVPPLDKPSKNRFGKPAIEKRLKRVSLNVSDSMAVVVPFLNRLRNSMRSASCPMAYLEQVGSEVYVYEEKVRMASVLEAFKARSPFE